MIINADTKISELIKHNASVIDRLVILRPAFKKLKNPILRKVLTPRVSISQACKMGNCTVEEFFLSVRDLGFEPENFSDTEKQIHETKFSIEGKNEFYLDIDNYLETSKDPFPIILNAIKEKENNSVICLCSSFDPVPLKQILSEKNILFFSVKSGENKILTYIQPGNWKNNEENVSEYSQNDFLQKWNELSGKMEITDVRGMEMPQPLLIITDKLQKMKKGQALGILHERKPELLLERIKAAGMKTMYAVFGESDVRLIVFV
jgi:TusA-related sulfurtransferase